MSTDLPPPGLERSAPATITALSSMATRQILADLAAAFEARTGVRVAIESVGGVIAAERVRSGERFDIVVLASDAMERLADDGHVVRASLSPFAVSGIAAAVPSGAVRPDLGDAEAFKRASLAAGRLCISTGPSGTHLRRLWESWGIDTTDPDRVRLAPPGIPVARLLAGGEVDLGFQQRSELIGEPGIDVIDTVSEDIQVETVFVSGLCAVGSRCQPSIDFMTFIASKHADGAKTGRGMEPPR